MATKTISIEQTAYEKLKAAKRPGESFSEAIHRILGPREPSLLEFAKLLDRKSADRVAEAIARARAEDIAVQKRRLAQGR